MNYVISLVRDALRVHFARLRTQAPFLFVMVVVAVAILYSSSIMGCHKCQRCARSQDFFSAQTRHSESKGAKVHLDITGWKKGEKLAPGQFVSIKMRAVPTGDDYPADIDIVWTPPEGATEISVGSFGADYTVREDGTYVFTGWSVYDELEISVKLPEGEGGGTVTTTGVARDGDGGSHAATMYGTTREDLPVPEAAQAPQLDVPQAVSEAGQAGGAWRITRLGEPQGVTLTTELCQDWVGFLQTDEVFVAASLPLSPTSDTDDAYALPLIMADPYSATVDLVEYGVETTRLLTLPLELRPQHFAFLENEIPPPAGKHWIALGPEASTVACPADLEIPPGAWGIVGSFEIDMSHQPDACRGCTVDLHYFYQGQDPPWPAALGSLVRRMVADRVTGDMAVTSFQDDGITGMGPDRLTLAEGMAWELGGSDLDWITPTRSISVSNYVWTYFGPPMTFTLTYTSTLGEVWNFYSGTQSGPDLPLVELGNPIRSNPLGAKRYFWPMAQLPPDMEAGPHTLVITATRHSSPAERATLSNLFWVGEWQAPPTGDGDTTRVYLPLVQRMSP